MSHEKDGQKNEKIVKLIKQVKTLSKVVNELQAEVDNLKSQAHMKDNPSTSKEPEIAEANGPKSNRFQRLNFFRKDSKTKEGKAATQTVSSKNIQTIDGTINDTISNGQSRHKNISQPAHLESQPFIRERPFENKSERRDRSTQSIPCPKEVEFSCIVETCPEEGDSDFEDFGHSQESMESDSRSTCNECHKRKKSKRKKEKIKGCKLKTSGCDKDCPYLIRSNKNKDKKKKKKYKLKKKDSVDKNCCVNESRSSNNKQCRDKKTMVNFTKDDKTKIRTFFTNNDNFSLDCKLFEGTSNFNENDDNRHKSGKFQLLDHSGKCIKVKETYCKRCFKKCKTKNVVKINKAILTQEPPVIIMSPRTN